jgi:hypothetical protein
VLGRDLQLLLGQLRGVVRDGAMRRGLFGGQL